MKLVFIICVFLFSTPKVSYRIKIYTLKGIQYNPSNTATLGTQQNGPIWGVALLEGWAIPDAIEIGGEKTIETRTF